MSPDPSPSAWEVVKQLIGGIKNQLLLFALATIIVIALLGTTIPPAFIALIYFVVIFALVVTALPAIRAARRKSDQASATRSGGVDMRDGNTHIGGDVVGRDQIIVMPAAAPDKPATVPLSEVEQLKVYLDKVMADTNVLRLGGISSEASDPQRRLAEAKNPGTLSEVFISLKIDRYRGEPDEQAQRGKSDPREIATERDREQLTALEALSADKAAYAVLLGLPGAGKSSVLRYLSYRLAEAYLRPQQLKDTLPEWKSSALLPVFLSLAKLADALPEKVERGLDARVRLFIETEVEAAEDLQGFATRLWREARERGLLFLFDGLDEVAPHKRAVVKEALTAFLSTRRECRAIVTCRTFSYGDEAWRLDGWPAFQLTPLAPKAQQEFIGKWYAALIRNDAASQALYEKKAASLQQAIFSHDARQLQQISDNPLLLTLIAIVHTHREELPRSRVRIYEECVNLLLLRWQTRRSPTAPLRSVLEAMNAAAPDRTSSLEGQLMRGLYEVAFQAREGNGLRQGETTLIDEYALRSALVPKLGEGATQVFVEYCQSANGLLLAQGSRRLPDRPADEKPVECYAFPHPSFEEYLAARYIAMLDQPHVTLAQRNAENDRWFYVGVFLAEYASIVSQRPRDVLDLTDALLAGSLHPERSGGRPSTSSSTHFIRSESAQGAPAAQSKDAALPGEGYWRNVWLAGVVWPIFCGEFPDRNDEKILSRVRQELTTLITTEQLSPRERAEAGRALSALGDPRDFDDVITIPAGKFWMGSDKTVDQYAYDDELPQHEVDVPEFQIGTYPVTVKQWRAFVEAQRFEGDPDALQAPDNHPVVKVSWRDAQAYCQWLTQQWQRSGKIKGDEVVRLPTEAEWEKAARGTDKRLWSWVGDYDPQKANVAETGIGGTSTVGCFPSGTAPYGCLDMIGNVREWTHSRFEEYPYAVNDGREDESGDNSRVLRGGAFFNLPHFARCAYRDDYLPVGRDGFVGFRVVVSPGSRS